jgi:serine/threonine-protein kinase
VAIAELAALDALLDDLVLGGIAVGPQASDGPADGAQEKGSLLPHLTCPERAELAKGEAWPQIEGYEILEKLGQGGMGIVYKAHQLRPSRIVALKMLRNNSLSKDSHRFHREAEAVAGLQHPNIVQVYEVGEIRERGVAGDDSPVLYFSMEYIADGSLDKAIAGAPQPPRLAAQLVETIARAVHHAHRHGIVHRDLKPANILLQKVDTIGCYKLATDHSLFTSDYIPKITDFGLAKRLDEMGQTQSGDILGTPSYMAPEQAEGRVQVGPRTDVYSLGAILYELVTGRPPHRGANMLETLDLVRTQEPVPPSKLQPKLPRDLNTICLKALAKPTAERYATADEMADDLRRFLNGEPIRARPAGLWERSLKWMRRRPSQAAAAALGVIAVVAGLYLGWILVSHAAERKHLRLQDLRKERASLLQRFVHWPHAAAAAHKLPDGGNEAELQLQFDLLRKDLATLRALEQIRVNKTSMLHHPSGPAGTAQAYQELFQKCGIDPKTMAREEIAANVSKLIRVEIATAIDDWALVCRSLEQDRVKWSELLELARMVDPDEVRGRIRTAFASSAPGSALTELSDTADVSKLPPVTIQLLGRMLGQAGGVNAATKLLRRAQSYYPNDYWMNSDLAWYIGTNENPSEALRYFTAALALRPDYAPAHNNVGAALSGGGRYAEAAAAFREAVRLDPSVFGFHFNLGSALRTSGNLDEAITSLRHAVGLNPKHGPRGGPFGYRPRTKQPALPLRGRPHFRKPPCAQ